MYDKNTLALTRQFLIIISSKNSWTGKIVPTTSTNYKIVTNDRACTAPEKTQWVKENNGYYSVEANTARAKSSDGYVIASILGVSTINENIVNSIAYLAKPINGVPRDCQSIDWGFANAKDIIINQLNDQIIPVLKGGFSYMSPISGNDFLIQEKLISNTGVKLFSHLKSENPLWEDISHFYEDTVSIASAANFSIDTNLKETGKSTLKVDKQYISFSNLSSTDSSALVCTELQNGKCVTPSPVTNQAPTTSFTANPTSGNAPLTVNVNASASSDPDGRVATYSWSTSDGKSSNDLVTSFAFNQAGTFTITLTVTDDKGATGTTSKTSTVSQPVVTPTPQPPQPNPVPASNNGTGYIEGNILDACNQKPLKSVKLSFNGTPQQSDRDGHYVIELNSGSYTVSATYTGYNSDSRSIDLSTDETRIGNFNLTPTVGCENIQPAKTKQALIIAGSGPKLLSGDNHIWESTQALADRAYTSLRLQSFKREEIRYLSADSTPRDADGDSTNDINSAATLDSVQQALTQWAGGVEQMVVYFIGHGGIGTFQLNRDEQLKPAQLKVWLGTLQSKLIKDQRGQPGKLTLVIDACKAGSFVAPLAASNRYIIASTQPDLDAIISNKDGSNSFSYHFWGQIGFKDGWLSSAFQQARQSMSSELVDRGKTQKAMLDADGSGDDTTEADYATIGNYCYGNCTPHASVPVVIESVSPLDNLNGNLSRTLRVRASKDIAKAWVSIQRPDYHFPTDGTAINTLLTVNLNCDGSNSCQANYNNFNLNDNYQVTFNVIDKDGNTAVPYTATLYQSGITASNEKKAAPAVYESTTGVLTLKDVIVDGKHYYVELKDQGGYRFSVQNLYQLTEAAKDTPANFDGSKVIVSSVYAFGHYYAVDLVMNGNTFVVSNATQK